MDMFSYNDVTKAFFTAVPIIAMVYFLRGKKKAYPPGPTGIPLLGYVPFLGKNIGETMTKLRERYGDVFSVRMGSSDWIILNRVDLINEAFVKNGDICSGRPSIHFEQVAKGTGVLFADYGPTWKTFRRFGVSTLRGFGVGKKSMERNIAEEARILTENLSSKSGDLHTKLAMCVANVICRILFGSRFMHEDAKFKQLVGSLKMIFSDTLENKIAGLVLICPTIRHFPFLSGLFDRRMKDRVMYEKMLRSIIDEHAETFDKNDIRDFIDAFLLNIQEKGDNDPAFCVENLLKYIVDLFDAGSATIIGTLLWCVLGLVHFPQCQKRIADEVELVLGSSGVPNMGHVESMPFTRAYIEEIMRHRTLVALGVFHKTSQDMHIGGFVIPKDTTVCANIYAVHHDRDVFRDPDTFNPDRFLNDQGKFVKSSHAIPFSVGPRICLGESLARMELFIILVSIVQRFQVVENPAIGLPSFTEVSFNGFSLDPVHFEVNFQSR